MVYSLLPLVLAAAAAAWLVRNLKRLGKAGKTTGRISSKLSDNESATVHYEYYVNGKFYLGKTSYGIWRSKEGDPLDIYFDPENPKISGNRASWLAGPLIALCISLALLAAPFLAHS